MIAALAAWLAAASPPLEPVVLVVQGSSVCAGALLDAEGRVATAYHCVASGGRPRVELRDGRSAVGRVLAAEPRADLAVVEVPALAGLPWLPVAPAMPGPGDPVFAVGHPYGARPPTGFFAGTLRWSTSAGVVAAVGERALQVTAPLNPGNSGGPVVDGEGRLVGVVSRRLRGQGLGFAGRADRLPDLLADPRGLSALGGTLELGAWGTSWLGADGGFSAGARLALVVRDRVELSGALAAPAMAPRWEALRRGSTTWQSGELVLGLRQRVGRGPFAVRLDAWAGLASASTMSCADGAPASLRRADRALPAVGGALGWGSARLDVGAAREGDAWTPRLAIGFAWPGTLAVF